MEDKNRIKRATSKAGLAHILLGCIAFGMIGDVWVAAGVVAAAVMASAFSYDLAYTRASALIGDLAEEITGRRNGRGK